MRASSCSGFWVLSIASLLIDTSFSMLICEREQQIIHGPFYQRVDLNSSLLCVERCIEYMDVCHKALFVVLKGKENGICQLHPNISTDDLTVDDDFRIAETTVFELQEKCAAFTKSKLMEKLSEESMNRLLEPRKNARAVVHSFDEDIILREDAFAQNNDEMHSNEITVVEKRAKGYAIMQNVDEQGYDDNPSQNPFDMAVMPSSSESKERPSYLTKSIADNDESISYGPAPNLKDLVPIKPIQILHQGLPIRKYDDKPPIPPPLLNSYAQHQNGCKLGAPCVPTLFQLDKSPCPAHQGDPCAPRPKCAPPLDAYVESPPKPCDLYGSWSEWSSCSATCGVGQVTRTCSTGNSCIGLPSAPCFMPLCLAWGPWGQWTPCSATCGNSQKQRRRHCLGGDSCVGGNLETEDCALPSCPEWSNWGPWEGCTQICGFSKQKRYRQCSGGLNCPGLPIEEKPCEKRPCPHWSNWAPWSQCSSSCGGGERIRSRECINGPGCMGDPLERQVCSAAACPSWTEWTSWTLCPQKCGEETVRLRNRICLFNEVQYTGCEGSAQDQSPCPVTQCPKWKEWGDWTECSQTCGQGTQIRTRSCDGNGCDGPTREMRFCQISICPYWGEWGQWTGCSVTCGIGKCQRKRKCILDDLVNLPNLDELEAVAAADEESSEEKAFSRIANSFESYSQTHKNKSDPFGFIMRKRRTTADGVNCDGNDVDTKSCDAGPCCSWDAWTEWSPCIGCGEAAISRRTRTCSGDALQNTADSFQGDSTLTLPSYSSPPAYATTPTNLVLDTFKGLRPIVPVNFRGKRESQFPYAQFSRDCQCEGPAFDTKACSAAKACETEAEFSHDTEVYPTLRTTEVAVECEWTQWGEWCGCQRCRPGKEVRRRFCDLPPRTRGGPTRPDPNCRCTGSDMEHRACEFDESCLTEINDNNRDKYQRPLFPKLNTFVDSASYNTDDNQDGKPILSTGKADENNVDYAGPIFTKVEIDSIPQFPWNSTQTTEEQSYDLVKSGHENSRPYRKDSSIITEQGIIGDLCRWSKWSSWSPCETSRLQQRNRFCIGADSPSSSCQCMGLSTEETSCTPHESVASSVEFIALTNTNKQRNLLQERRGLLTGIDRRHENALISSEIECTWTKWSQWSACTATCGSAQKLRKRRCTCSKDGACGESSDTQSETCSQAACENRAQLLPQFSIF